MTRFLHTLVATGVFVPAAMVLHGCGGNGHDTVADTANDVADATPARFFFACRIQDFPGMVVIFGESLERGGDCLEAQVRRRDTEPQAGVTIGTPEGWVVEVVDYVHDQPCTASRAAVQARRVEGVIAFDGEGDPTHISIDVTVTGQPFQPEGQVTVRGFDIPVVEQMGACDP